jgi:hypothetical protein
MRWIRNLIAGYCGTSNDSPTIGPFVLPVLPNGPLAGTTRVVSVTTTAQDIAIPDGTGLIIIKVLATSTCGYVGYRFKYPESVLAVALGDGGTFRYSLTPGEVCIEVPIDKSTAISIACDLNTATVHVFFRT